jgi:hypothetical protein
VPHAIGSALRTAAFLGLWFPTTRGIAIVAVAIMAAAQPWLVVPIAIGSAAAFYVFRLRK